mgnify:FL=1
MLYEVLISSKFQEGLRSIKGVYEDKVRKNIEELAEYIRRLNRKDYP